MKTLILAGGRSRRMGRDKSRIERPDGTRQLDHLIGFVQTLGLDPILSTNDPDAAPDGIPTLADRHPGAGPLAALEAFHAAHPDEAVLLLGCDLFLLDDETLRFLLDRHDASQPATAFANRLDGQPEPLCAIYEPAALARTADAIARDACCARRFLASLDPTLLDLPHPAALDNANTPTELDEVFAKLRHGVTPRSVRAVYFAKLREARGLGEETVQTLAHTAGGLYEELRFRHHLPLGIDALRCARNGDFCEWNTPLAPDDEIVFMPPFAGG